MNREVFVLPASSAQQRLWFLDRALQSGAAYNVCQAFRLHGPLDASTLAAALDLVVARHESLRTSFKQVDSDLRQIIHPEMHVPVTEVALPSADADVLGAALRAEGARPFDLAEPPLLRVTVFHLQPHVAVLAVIAHHIVVDGWSMVVLLRDLAQSYQALARGATPELVELPVQYADFTFWEQQLQGGPEHPDVPFWRERIQGADVPLDLPADRPPTTTRSFRGHLLTFRIEPALTARLRALGRDGGSVFMAALTAYAVVLHRLTGAAMVPIGAPVANRPMPELENVIGFFANTVVFRADLRGDLSLRDAVARVRRDALDVYSHQSTPFDQIVRGLGHRRADERNPLFQVALAHQQQPDLLFQLPGIETVAVEVANDTAKFEILIELRERTTHVDCLIEMSDDLFTPDAAVRFRDHFLHVLTLLVDEPERRLSQISLVSANDRAVIDRSNATRADFPSDHTITELFDEQARATPAATAIATSDGHVNYADLQRRAGLWSRRLRALGAGPGAFVALCLPRSVDLLTALLAILDAGAAYVPIDVRWPEARQRLVLDESGASVLVTNAATTSRLAGFAGPILIIAGGDERLGPPTPDPVEPRQARATDAAYVLFTSGSTGRPKGVVMPHRPLVNLLAWHQRHPRLGQPARTLQFAPVEFDVSFQDIVATWCTGGAVVVVDDDTRRDPRALLDVILSQRIQRIYMPFVALQQLAEVHAARQVPLPDLRDVVSAGEALRLTPEIRALIASAGGPDGCRLHNHYGPTEAHVVTAHELPADPSTWPEVAPIGRPIANVRIHVLDDAQQPLPLTAPGELYIAGECLAAGYHNRSDLTAERFVAVAAFAGERMYRTGDRARWRPDGTLEFLGRIDDQVKIRGHRVELGEVEAVAARVAGVTQAAAAVRADRVGVDRLIGYVVPAAGADVSSASVLAEMRRHLPEYMVPAAIVILPRLPLLPSSKLDRAALPAPSFDVEAESDVAPATGPDATVAGIWREILGVNHVGPHDSFFDLGGHSIMAVRMIARVEAALGAAPPLRAIFEHPTLSEFSRVARGLTALPRARVGVTCVHQPAPEPGRGPLVVMPSMFGYADAWRPIYPALDRTVYAVEFGGDWSPTGDGDATPSLETIAAAAVAEIRRLVPEGNVHLVGYSFGGRLAYEVGRQLGVAGQPPRSIVIIDTTPGATSRAWSARDAASIVANLPRWVMNELRVYGAAALWRRARARWRFRRPTTNADIGALDPDAADAMRYALLGRMFEIDSFAPTYRRRLLDMLEAFERYEPTPTGHHVIYMSSQIRPLVHRWRPDGGWSAFVPPDRLQCITLPGDHGSVLHPRWHRQVTAALRQVLDGADSAPPL
jgi:amino acid adenylation domain-containing protein